MPAASVFSRLGSALLTASVLCSCATTTAERVIQLEQDGQAHGFAPVHYGAAPALLGMLRTEQALPLPYNVEEDAGQALWIVIEGDGRAWLNPHLPSSDPTPLDPVGWPKTSARTTYCIWRGRANISRPLNWRIASSTTGLTHGFRKSGWCA